MTRVGHSIYVVLFAVCGTVAVRAQPAATPTAVPRLVKFNGTLTGAAGKPITGVAGVTFALYASEQGGSPLWMETQNVQAGGSGQYTVLLGSTTNQGLPAEAFASGQRWLGVQPQGEAERSRILMTSVPYSLKAVDAETLGGLPASAYALAGPERAMVAQPAVGKTVQPAGPATPNASPSLTGAGTKNYIPIWTSASALATSKIYQTTAGNIGIGTITPAATLQAVATGATGTGVIGQATATSGTNYGVYGSTASPSGIAVYGNATSGTGVAGSSVSPTGYAVYGANIATTGSAYGIYGTTASTGGVGALGTATAGSGLTYGVYGSVLSPAGVAVYGTATGGTGVAGNTTGATGYGVYGANTAATGNAFGVYGSSASSAGYAVYGNNTAASGSAYGVAGTTASSAGVGVLGVASAANGTVYGVYGSSVSPTGVSVYGTATKGTGVVGATASGSGYGVYGANNSASGNAFGVYGTTASTAGYAVRGVATASSGTSYGVYGASLSPNGVGVAASATGSGTALSATAQAGGLAGQFSGNVKITGNLTVTGTVSKGGGSFRIDHPLDPQHKYLYHSFVESPDMMNIYNGVVTLSKSGDAVVKLPEWFDALNRDFRYQLTCIGGFAPVYIADEVAGNQFKIGGGKAGMKVSWQVTGIRKDAFANEHRIPVEESKPPVE